MKIESDVLAEYKNGNANVVIRKDGTREISTEDDEFDFEHPCNADIKITNKCFMGCKMCHENSVPDGKHAPLENFEFLKSWHAGCECSYGGGMITLYPHLDKLLKMTKDCGLISNITLHQDELVNNFDMIKSYQENGLLYGIGVSYSHEDDKLIECVNKLDNVVSHVIAGLVKYEDLKYLSKNFKNPKLLLLGYKHFRRGNQLYDKIGEQIEKNIKELSFNFNWCKNNFNVISYDNLAINQLRIKDRLSEEEWNEFYQGDEGTMSMYIDAVNGEFAVNSTSTERFKMTNNIRDMFAVVKEHKKPY